MLSTISGVDRETITPDRLATILSGFSEESLNSCPAATRVAGGSLMNGGNTVDEVLSQFPLDGPPWQRTVAISFLETEAQMGRNGDVTVVEILQSYQAKGLTATERGRLLHILGKTE